MKIGEFSQKNKLSIDTIRHYMDLGLVIPVKEGSHYHFDNRCQRDLDEILQFKDMGFTLNEIQTIFLHDRFAKLTSIQETDYYRGFFQEKDKEISNEIESLKLKQKRLHKKLTELSSKSNQIDLKIGLDLSCLNILKCIKCNGSMVLQDGVIKNNHIINGNLQCSCGNNYLIEEGILFTDKKDEIRERNKMKLNYFLEYIDSTHSEYLNNIHKGLEWIYKKSNFSDFDSKVILDLGITKGLFLRYILGDLPSSSLYIAIDSDIEKLRFIKNIINRSQWRKKVIFIHSSLLNIPIKDKSVDIIVDLAGTSKYGLENKTFLLESLNKHIKDNSLLIGGYIIFKKFGINTIISEECRQNFILDTVKKNIQKMNYNLYEEMETSFLPQAGKYENYYKGDEKVYFYITIGKR